jgi:hypothetical protein
MAGFTMNADDATRLMERLAENKAKLLADIRRETLAAGRRIQASARANAKSQSMPGLSGSIWTKTKQLANGIEVTVEAKSPFGYIREYGAGRSGPMPFMRPALDEHVPAWEQAIVDAASRVM